MKLSHNDQQLLNRSFSMADPETLENMSPTMPVDYQNAVVEFEYDVNPGKNNTRNRIWCAHDGYPTHWKGYVMRVGDIRFLIGHDCGAKIYGLEFKKTEREFDHLKERKNQLLRLQRIFEKLPAMINSLNKLLSAPSLIQMRILQNKLQNDFTKLTQSLRIVACSPNRMVSKTISVRDTASEAARADRNTEKKAELSSMTTTVKKRLRNQGKLPQLESEANPIFKMIEEDAFVLRGKSLLLQDSEGIRKQLEIENAGLKAVYNELKDVDSDKLKRNAILRLFKKLDASKTHFEEIVDYLKAPGRFLHIDHVMSIVEWANSTLDMEDKYSLKDGVFSRQIRTAVDEGKMLDISNAYDQPNIEFFAEFFANRNTSTLKQAA